MAATTVRNGNRRASGSSGATRAVAQCFSADDPDSLRGPQFGAAWADELAKWRYADAAWDMLQFGLRLGAHPCELVTTTPRPIPLLKRLAADPSSAVTTVTTRANALNLAPAFLDRVVARYAGTRLGRQELEGAFIEERADALFSRDMVEGAPSRRGAPDGAHRRRGGSACGCSSARRRLRDRGGRRDPRGRALRAGGRDRGGGPAGRLGRAGDRALPPPGGGRARGGGEPGAARWCAACWRRSIPPCP